MREREEERRDGAGRPYRRWSRWGARAGRHGKKKEGEDAGEKEKEERKKKEKRWGKKKKGRWKDPIAKR